MTLYKFLVRVMYSNTSLYENIKAKDGIGYVTATLQSRPLQDSACRPNASIALFTREGAEKAARELKQQWYQWYYRPKNQPIPKIEVVEAFVEIK